MAANNPLPRDQELAPGLRLVACYKGSDYQAQVVRVDDRTLIRVDGIDYSSLSLAARAVAGGTSVNGWRFWRLPADAPKAKRGRPTNAERAARDAGGATCAGSAPEVAEPGS